MPAFGFSRKALVNAMAKSKAEATLVALDADPLAHAVRALLDENDGQWSGTPTALLNAVRANADRDTKSDLPRAANALTNRLQRLAPTLRDVGIDVTMTRSASSRCIELARSGNGASSSSSAASPAKKQDERTPRAQRSTVTDAKPHRHDGPRGSNDDAARPRRHVVREASREHDVDDDDDGSSRSSSSAALTSGETRAAVEAG